MHSLPRPQSSWARFVLILAAGAFACSSPFEQRSERVIGILDAGAGPFPLSLPDTAHAGVPFTITVTTFGGGCDQADGADVRASDLSVDVTPYDRLPAAGTICVAILRTLPRPVPLTFGTTGTAVVRVHGRGPNGAVTVQGTVEVRP